VEPEHGRGVYLEEDGGVSGCDLQESASLQSS
jgi:hypothetical protein